MLVQHAPKNSNRAVQKNSFDVMLRAVSSSIVKNPRDLQLELRHSLTDFLGETLNGTS